MDTDDPREEDQETVHIGKSLQDASCWGKQDAVPGEEDRSHSDQALYSRTGTELLKVSVVHEKWEIGVMDNCKRLAVDVTHYRQTLHTHAF